MAPTLHGQIHSLGFRGPHLVGSQLVLGFRGPIVKVVALQPALLDKLFVGWGQFKVNPQLVVYEGMTLQPTCF